MSEPKYRHELKYYMNQGDYIFLSGKLAMTMERDANANERGEYFIRSLYFDDAYNSAFAEKLYGTDNRLKIRLRTYNLSDKLIKLECKNKDAGYIRKESINLSRAECEELLSGGYGFLLSRPERFALRMFAEFSSRRLKPAVIVDYTRETFVFPLEEVRVTFDKNIRTAYRATDLFNRRLVTYPAVEGRDMVLEIKYNRYLPTYIRSLLQVAAPERCAISKYCLCRQYEV